MLLHIKQLLTNNFGTFSDSKITRIFNSTFKLELSPSIALIAIQAQA